jgi:hypothetical protein
MYFKICLWQIISSNINNYWYKISIIRGFLIQSYMGNTISPQNIHLWMDKLLLENKENSKFDDTISYDNNGVVAWRSNFCIMTPLQDYVSIIVLEPYELFKQSTLWRDPVRHITVVYLLICIFLVIWLPTNTQNAKLIMHARNLNSLWDICGVHSFIINVYTNPRLPLLCKLDNTPRVAAE